MIDDLAGILCTLHDIVSCIHLAILSLTFCHFSFCRSLATGRKHPNVGITFTWFTARDVVRHPMVQRIVEAYDRASPDSSVVHDNDDA